MLLSSSISLTRAFGRRVALRTSLGPNPNRSSSRVPSAAATNHAAFAVPDRADTVLLGCVSYDPAVGDIWTRMRTHLRTEGGMAGFDFVLFHNYEQQVRALLDGAIDVAWNGPIAHVLCERNADIVSLGMRDVDCDFESIVAVTKASGVASIEQLRGTTLLSGAEDSPQGHVVPLHYLKTQRQLEIVVEPQNLDLGKHGDTALGEVAALELLANSSDGETYYSGALLSRMMWDRAVGGHLDTVDPARLRDRAFVLESAAVPTFDHCQFDAMAATAETGKLDAFYDALHAMDMSDPAQRPVMELEGIRKSWAKPRQEGYEIVREAMAPLLGGGGGMGSRSRARNFVPKSGVERAFSTTAAAAADSDDVAPLLPPGGRVGVIGSGVAGLQCIRSLRARGYEVVAFDKAPDVGGLWRENYANYALQVPKQLYEMPDLTMDEARWDEVAAGEKVQAYIKRFAETFDLESSLRLNTEIAAVSRNENEGTWTFTTDGGESHVFDYCVMATGMYSSIPNLPDVPNRDAFVGPTMHSSHFRDATAAHDRRVVVVGGGKSATDCATTAARAGARSVTLLQRAAHWPTPLHIAGLIPFQHVFLSRLGQALVEAKVGVYPGSSSVASMFRPVMGAIFGVVEALFALQFGLKGDLRPKVGVVEDFYGYAQVQDGTFKAMRDSGPVQVRLGEAQSFVQGGLRLTNGEEIPADLVVFATGFGKDYSRLFEPDIVQRLDVQDDGIYLYRHVLPPSVDGLAFVGSETATIFSCTSYGLQAEWLARTLAGETRERPTDEVKGKEALALRDFARSWMPKTSSRSALVLLHQIHYHDQLLRDMGENPARK